MVSLLLLFFCLLVVGFLVFFFGGGGCWNEGDGESCFVLLLSFLAITLPEGHS